MRRLIVSLVIGVATACVCPLIRAEHRIGGDPVDFMWSYFAARDLATGRDPYAAPPSIDMIPYPMPAVLIALPIAWLPIVPASLLFIGGSSALLAYGLLRDGE